MAEFTWKICKGLNDELIDKFNFIYWINEKDVNSEGFIQSIEEYKYDK